MTKGDVLNKASDYRTLVIYKDNAHYAMTQRANFRHTVLGVVVIVTSAVVSLAIFSTLEESPDVGWQIAAGSVSVLAAVSAALQTFLRLSDKAEQHRQAAAGYSQLRRRLELFELAHKDDTDVRAALADLETITKRLDELESSSLPIDDGVYDRVKKAKAKDAERRVHYA